MTHHFVAFSLVITVSAFLVRKKHSETENREIFNFLIFSKWRHSDRKWPLVVQCMTKWPNDHFSPYFSQKTFSLGILKSQEKLEFRSHRNFTLEFWKFELLYFRSATILHVKIQGKPMFLWDFLFIIFAVKVHEPYWSAGTRDCNFGDSKPFLYFRRVFRWSWWFLHNN